MIIIIIISYNLNKAFKLICQHVASFFSGNNPDLNGGAYLPIILCGSFHQEKRAMSEGDPYPLHISVVAILLLRHEHS